MPHTHIHTTYLYTNNIFIYRRNTNTNRQDVKPQLHLTYEDIANIAGDGIPVNKHKHAQYV